MKLITKISLSAITVFSIALIGGGYAMVELSYSSELRRTEVILDDAAKRIAASTDTLSSALVVADETDVALTMAFVDMDRAITTIAESAVRLDVAPTVEVMAAAAKNSVLVSDPIE